MLHASAVLLFRRISLGYAFGSTVCNRRDAIVV
jgi:hypothetical protein